ncbi:fluoride efflux transporter FluC [Alicyclobacillus pomorum]|jgi:fluoride exporter|uniref:fluoride efflux transporter FluC n=1 Tax=Alicyclobacillus pomorum TaxID=204470 RepID=UPI000411BC69|nr:CrcB family protein [Alicyclobacillus pomorum]
MNVVAIFLGGILGGILRYLVGFAIPAPDGFPLDILIINLVGSFALGALYGMAARTKMKPWLRDGIGTGFIGSFTTFSTFCFGTIKLAQSHAWMALIYVVASLSCGPLLAYVGNGTALWIGTRRETQVGEVSA